ncbi:unnamed protein product [Linum trigynum]|uniref:Reverse transcriptase domain-containing protein n=1 Tax=Linum trigynum TaxID=586398 RepID=A0AAV2DAX2_9ROSI
MKKTYTEAPMGDPNREDPMALIQATLAQMNASFQQQLDHITRRLDEMKPPDIETETEPVVAQAVQNDPNNINHPLDERLRNVEQKLFATEDDPNPRNRGNRDFGRRINGAELDGPVTELRGIKLAIPSF